MTTITRTGSGATRGPSTGSATGGQATGGSAEGGSASTSTTPTPADSTTTTPADSATTTPALPTTPASTTPATPADTVAHDAQPGVATEVADNLAGRADAAASGPGMLGFLRNQNAEGVALARPIPALPEVQIDPADGGIIVDGKRPATWPQLADATYQLATTIDQTDKGSALGALTIEQRGTLLDHLDKVESRTALEGEPTQALGADQATQLRSSLATARLDVVASLLDDTRPEAQALLTRGVDSIQGMIKTEDNKLLQESMAFGLYRHRDRLPAPLQARVDETTPVIAPLAPPYERWMQDGKVTADLVLGDSDGYRVRSVENTLKSAGFEEQERAGSVRVFKATLSSGDEATPVEVRLRIKRNDDLFAQAGKEGTDVILYTGHSSYGRNIPASIGNAPEAQGDGQVMFIETCFGKDNLHQMRQAFPGAQIMTTFNSATTSGDFSGGLRALFDGIGKRSSWAEIDSGLSSYRSANLVTPIEVMQRRRIMDADKDGRADVFDQLYDINLQDVEGDSARAFSPRDPGAMPHRLQAISGVVSANWVNRGVGAYNQSIEAVNPNSSVWSRRFFQGTDADPPVRFERVEMEDGTKGWAMDLNHRYAHMPEEALRVAAAWEFNEHLAQTESRFDYHNPDADADLRLQTRVNGLLGVAFTLSHDASYNDVEMWRGFLARYDLPQDLSLSEVERYCELNGASDMNVHGGSRANVKAYIDHLRQERPEIYAALRD